jgi:hypothetical protein
MLITYTQQEIKYCSCIDLQTWDNIKITVFWDVIPCSLVNVYECFRGKYSLYFQGRRIWRIVWKIFGDLPKDCTAFILSLAYAEEAILIRYPQMVTITVADVSTSNISWVAHRLSKQLIYWMLPRKEYEKRPMTQWFQWIVNVTDWKNINWMTSVT